MNQTEDFIDSFGVEISHGSCLSAAKKLAALVAANDSEMSLQKHIEEHPFLISQQFTHCHHVAPNFSFGGKLVADFMCLDWPSGWPHWVAVEIEAPSKSVMTKNGRRSSLLEHALQQIRDWREFVKNNLDFVNKPRAKNGLGLEHAEPNMSGHVYIGRRFTDAKSSAKWRTLRNQIADSEGINVYSWDGFVEHALMRAKFFDSVANGITIRIGDREPITMIPRKSPSA
jgi:Domain of unknown function (DUF4263)